MIQTSVIKLSITFNIRAVLTKYPKSGHVANESHYSYTGYTIAQQDAEVFIKRQSNILIMTLVTVTYNNFLISCPIELL